jgi:hypothetical protein
MSPRAVWDRIGDRIRALPDRDRRALLIGVLLLAPALLWIAVVRPYTGAVAELQDRVVSERALLERERSVLREGPMLPARLDAARADLARWESRLIRSANLALAEAEVSSLLEEIARENRVLLQEVRATPVPREATPPAGLRPIRLTARGESDFEGVLSFLHGMEKDPLLLRVVGLSVDRAASGGQGSGNANPPQPGAVSFVVIVEAFAPEGAPGAGI